MNKKERGGKIMNRKKIICLVGASASGKTTIGNALREKIGCPELISHCGREIRPGEIDGISYHFVNKEIFEDMIEKDMLVEYDAAYGNYYGLSKEVLNKTLKMNDVVYFVCTVKGLMALERYSKWNNLEVISFHVKAPVEVLKARLEARGDSEKQIEKRIKEAEKESQLKGFDFVIENTGDLQKAVDKIIEAINRKNSVLDINGKYIYLKTKQEISEIKEILRGKENYEDILKEMGIGFEYVNLCKI